MENPEKRCENCRRIFKPDPTKKKTQRFCSIKRCKQASHNKACRAYRRDNPDDDKARRPKIRIWAGGKAYWVGWRADHPEYREREKGRMRRKRQGSRRVAKRDLRKRLFVEDLRKLQADPGEPVAKRDLRDPRVDALLMCLIRRETSQNEIHAQGTEIPPQ